MAQITVRVIGADGRMGREHVAAYKAAGVELVEGKADIVSIASPDNTHGRYVIEALKQGSHVFCEKPLCTTTEELEEIKKSKNLHVGQNYPLRHQPVFRDLKYKIHELGEIYRAEAVYEWGRTHKLNEGWRKTDKNYSLVLGGMIHMIDLITWVTWMQIEKMSSGGVNKSAPGFPGSDTISLGGLMENGALCSIVMDGGTAVKQHAHVLRLYGTRNFYEIRNTEPTDKQACIREFLSNIESGEPVDNDYYAIRVALAVNKWA